ncbi:hypothetical protein G6O69_36345 [Pseudenhygromyxa sp. WMMC2535]|uniref:RCC1 domain-containing protein n=1 Tax=Pseudenhygromyxa sp. WMMC2535 TaxID=2712867 RepID=UPI0015519344|nr:hypothetical protein [Pseudenhygromyxa sp. WMMC2535]NVB43353.1 hypothetical protein [Pseudenhygromyxa sp. WMMC2535]
MRPRKNQAASLGLPLLLAALGASSLACSGVPFCEAMPDQCVAGDEAETGTETEGGTEDTSEPSVCGDGEVQGSEACDDGNAVDGDGCDNDCTLTAVAALSLGEQHVCALIDGGRVRCWGWNEYGQLGYGHNYDIGDDELPSDAGDLLLPDMATALSLGGHACALFEDGEVRCWGIGSSGQLGNGGTDNIGDDETLADLGGLGLSSVVELGLGSAHTCALFDGGAVSCWGYNESGELGYGNIASSYAPGESLSLGGSATKLGLGGHHSCALLEGHELRCWGNNLYGQLGLGHTNGVGDDELPDSVDLVSLGLSSDIEVVDVELGAFHTCALLSDGGVMCWGGNEYGQLGLGHINNIGDDESPSSESAVSLPGAVEQLALGGYHSCALLSGGEVSCWGQNQYGQLGLGHTHDIGDDELPEDAGLVELGGSALAIAAGGAHTCALLENHDVRCWGYNDSGQLGLGHTANVGDDESPGDVDPVSVL